MKLFKRMTFVLKKFHKSETNDHARDAQYSKSIELENGECINLRGHQNYLNNKIRTNQYSWNNFYYKLPYTFFKRYLNLYLFIINLLTLALNKYDLLQFSYITSFIISLFVHIIKELYFDYLKKINDETINSRQVTVFASVRKQLQIPLIIPQSNQSIKKVSIQEYEKHFNQNQMRDLDLQFTPFHRPSMDQHQIPSMKRQEGYTIKDPKIQLLTQKRWDELEVGEIILLKYNEVCPADILLLEMSTQVTYAKCGHFNGNTNEVRKKACSLTTISKEHKQQINQIDYRAMLSGVIRYDQSEQDYYYRGLVKLKKDPQPVEITKENIMFREQQLLNAYFIYGLIVGVGYDCRCYQGYKKLGKKKQMGFFEDKANSYILLAILILLALCLIQSLIEGYAISDQTDHNIPYFEILLLYSNLLPAYYYVFLDFVILVQIVYKNYKFIHSDYEHVQQHSIFQNTKHLQPNYLQLNFGTLADLALVNHILIDKTGTLTQPQFKIKSIFIFDNLYKIYQRVFDEKEFITEVQKSKLLNQLNYPIQEESPQKMSAKLQNGEKEEAMNFKIDDLDDENPPYDDMHKTVQIRASQQNMQGDSNISSQVEISDGSHKRLTVDKKLTGIQRPSKINVPKQSSHLEIVFEQEQQENQTSLVKRYHSDEEFQVHFTETMYACILCHNTRSLYSRQEDCLTYEYSSETDHLQLQFAAHFGFKYICRSFLDNQIKYIIEDDEGIKHLDIMAVHQFNSRRLSVIIKPTSSILDRFFINDENVDYIQYLRDDSLEMLGCLGLDKEQNQKLFDMINVIQKQGSRAVLIYRSLMNAAQMNEFIWQADKIIQIQTNKIESNGEYQFLMHEFQRSCDLVAIIGISEKVQKNAYETLDKIKSLGIPCWLASGDTYEKVLPIAYKTGLLQVQEQIVVINAKSIEELYVIMKNQLQSLMAQLKRSTANKTNDLKFFKRESFSSSPNILLSHAGNVHITPTQMVISGDSLNFINQDQYLKKHFLFLLQFTSNLIGFKMSPRQKAILIRYIKNCRLNYKNILAIGDSYSDINMFEQSDFAIQIETKRTLLKYEKYHFEKVQRERASINQLDLVQQHQITFPNAHELEHQMIEPISNTNLYLKELSQISKLLTYDNRYHSQLIDRILVYSLFRSFTLIYLLFIYSLINYAENTILIPKGLLVFHPNVFFILNCIFMTHEVYQQKPHQNTSDEFIFKINHEEFRKNKYLKYLSRITILPLIQATVICLFMQQSEIAITLDGKNLVQDKLGIGFFLVCLIAEQLKLFQRDYLKPKCIFLNIILIFAIYLLICFQLGNYWEENVFNWYKSMFALFAFIFIILFHLLFNTLVEIYYKPFFSTLDFDTTSSFQQISEIYHHVKILYRRKLKKHQSTFEKMSFFARKLFKNDDEMDQILKQMITGALSDVSIESTFSKVTMSFKSRILQNKFIDDVSSVLIRTFRIGNILTVLAYEMSSLFVLGVETNFAINNWIDIYLLTMIAAQFLLALYSLTKYYRKRFFQINLYILMIRMITLFIWYFNDDRYKFHHNLLILQIALVVMIFSYQVIPLLSILSGTSIIILFYFQNTNNKNTYSLINEYLFVTAAFIIISLIYNRIVCVFMDVFKAQITMIKENNSLKDILGILLPKFIRNRINKEGQFELSEDQGKVGILFCDISDFDTLIKNEQQNIINILDHLFRGYDQLCYQHGVQKIETVGKTYMAAAGLKAVEIGNQKSNPINKLISLALDMKKQTQSEQFSIKIGIHYGPVIAGVIGHHKPQFSLIGDTINKTSRVCSLQDSGDIAISEQAYQQTNKTDINFKLKMIDAKGLGIIKTYVIGSRRSNRPRQQTIRLPKVQQLMRKGQKQSIGNDSVATSQHKLDSSEMIGDNNSNRHLENVRLLNDTQRKDILNHVRKPTIRIESPQKMFSKAPSSSLIELKLQSSNKIEQEKEKKRVQDLMLGLEKATKCDLNISEFDMKIEDQVDRERAKQIYAADEEFQIQKKQLLTLNPKKFYFQFNEEGDATKEFRGMTIQHFKQFSNLFQYLVAIILLISSLTLFSIRQDLYILNIIIGIVVSGLYFTILYYIGKDNSEKFYNQSNYIVLSLLLYLSLAVDLFLLSDYAEIQISKGIVYNQVVNYNRAIQHESKLLLNLLYCLILLAAISYQDWKFSYFYYSFITMFFGFTMQLLMFFKNVSAYNATKQLQEKQIRQSNLLLYLLPKHILEQFFSSQSEGILVEQFEDVTLLFADIAGFTEYSSHVQPEQVVNMLRNLFTEFDKICLSQNVYKLYTIGDCYVVMGLINKDNRSPSQEALNVVSMGFQMIEVIRKVKAIVNFPGLNMRIGVHTGNIIGGVLGTELVRYDIYGPDVLIANKMESKGTKGFVQVSQETKDMIERDFSDFFRFEFSQQYEFESINRKTNGYFAYL